MHRLSLSRPKTAVQKGLWRGHSKIATGEPDVQSRYRGCLPRSKPIVVCAMPQAREIALKRAAPFWSGQRPAALTVSGGEITACLPSF